MHSTRIRKIFLGFALVLVILGGIVSVQARGAAPGADSEKIVGQGSPIHPTFELLDNAGVNVLESGKGVSTMLTCGQCHDTDFIVQHSFHSDLGMSDRVSAGQTASGRAWDTSPGLFGKWQPLLYRYLSPSGDSRVDLDNEEWVKFFADRLVGGGPAEASEGLTEASRVEMNCFLCHLRQPNNGARVEAIRSGKANWSATATLLGSGIIEQTEGGYQWVPEAFTADGKLDTPFLTLQNPQNENCAQCHAVVHSEESKDLILTDCSLDNWQTATTGQVVSPGKISLSGMNLANKSGLSHSWDIHAERGLSCTDCHYSLNNPAYYQTDAESRPEHLQYDPRRLEIGEYLQRPNHNFARGQSAQYSVSPELKGTMRRCESCHNAGTHADWLPYVERHMEEIACETCHVPKLYAPAVQSYDWTALRADGLPLSECRGVEGDSGTLNDLVTGFKPVLLRRSDIAGREALAPYNLVTTWYWTYEDPNGTRPVRLEDLQAAWLEGKGYHADVLSAFDADQDGQLSSIELRIDTPEKQAVIANRLEALGLKDPRIQAEIQPNSINHNVVDGKWATRECQDCHTDDSRLAAPMVLADYLPGGVVPEFIGDTNTQASSGLEVDEETGSLIYSPVTADHDLYVFGHNRISWIDWFGAFFFVMVLLGVAGHGTLRLINAARHPHAHSKTKRVYMYHVYERFWHWLQTFVIVLLLFTGLIIHRPDIFGFLSFRHMVTLHNVLAVILVINAGLSLFYHLTSGEIRQFIPRPYGFFDQAILQAKFYLQGIFKGKEHPFEKTPQKKMNPLQQVTYFGILNVLLPLQIITGALMWGVQRWSDVANMLGGLPMLAPFHSLVAWMFAAFIVAHVYLTTTGPEPLTGIRAMINGWEDVEVVNGEMAEEPAGEEPSHPETDLPQPAAAD
jgi:thiosulfate reductase cytochrome b subunit